MSNPNSRKWLPLALGITGIAISLGLGVWGWRAHVIKAQEARSFQKATELVAARQGNEALQVIRQRNRATKRQSDATLNAWLALEIEATAQAGQLPRLLALYERTPVAFKDQEAATLLLERALVHTANFAAFDSLRADWKGRETLASGWFELDVDALLVRGKREEAIQLLNSRSFEGPADCGRLARLALINTPGDLKAAWQFLDRAAKLDPRNADVRLFRGQILEEVGQLGLAHAEFHAAFAANTNNAYFRDQLGEFCRRNGNYELAVLTWANGLTNAQTTDIIWLRTAFWTKVTRTIKFDWSIEPPFGSLKPFVQYLIALPPDKFWDATAFAQTAEARRYEKQLQATFWLRLLDALQNGKEEEGMQLLEFNQFRQQSWNRDLESALIRVLAFRKTGAMRFPVSVNLPLSVAPPESRHELLRVIDALTRNPGQSPTPELDRLLRGKNAFAAVFLAAGWAEAALRLPHDELIPEGLPEWFAYGLTQATRFNRGNAAALEFAARQKSSPTLELLQGEILLAEMKTEEALRKLSALAASDSDVGERAAQLVAQTRFQQKQYDAARAAVAALPRFARSVPGQEMLARIALVQNKADEAERIYASIEKGSDEAKMFLAKKAFQEKNWPRARQLTEELLKNYPERAEFRVNLQEISKAEAAK